MSNLVLQEIGLRPSQLRAVEKKAQHAGTTASEYVRRLVERDLDAHSLDDILRPIREDFRGRSVTPDQLERIVRRARHAAQPPRAKGRRKQRP